MVRCGIRLGHHLHLQMPAREVAAVDGLDEIALMALAVLADEFSRLRVRQVLDALLAAQVELHPEALVGRVDEAERMASEAVHMAVGLRKSAIAHDDRDLVKCLGQQGPEVPVAVGVAQIAAWIALHRSVEVRELQWVAQEEHRRVVAHQVPVSLLGIELHGEAADVTLGVCGPAFAGDGREAHGDVRGFADLREHFRPSELRDVVGDRERAECRGPLSMHPPFGDDLPSEVRELLQVPDILQQDGAERACGHRVLVVDDRCAGCGGELRHGRFLDRDVFASAREATPVGRPIILGSR